MEEFSECCKNNIREVSKIDNEGSWALKRILRMLPFVIICSFIFIIFPEKSYACDCINVSAEEAFQNDVVFEGQVIEVGRKEGGGIEVLFEVKKIWKGTNSSQIIVYTNGGDCVFHFVEGGEYLIYSSQRGSENNYTQIVVVERRD